MRHARQRWTVRVMVVVWVRVPEPPWIVMVSVPIDALLVADKVSVLVAVVLLGLKEAVTPRGKPVADRVTLPAKPFCEATVMVDVTFAPRARPNEFGEAERAKFGRGVTVSESVVVCDNAPDLPVMVMVTVPRVALLLAVRVSVLVFVVLVGLNAAVTPAGRPEAERLTLPVNPLIGLTVLVLVPLPP